MSDGEEFSAIRNKLDGILDESYKLRFSGSLPPTESGPSAVLDSLRDVRARIDRLEELLLQSARFRAQAQRARQSAEASAEEAWDQSNQQQRHSPSARGGDFIAPRERYADSNLATLSERRALRKATELVSHADESYEAIRTMYRGLDGLRNDHLTVLRALQFESSLERTT